MHAFSVTGRWLSLLTLVACGLLAVVNMHQSASAQEKPGQQSQKAVVDPSQPAVKTAAEQNELHAKFQKLLTGAKMRGLFTVDGQALQNLQEEAYDISKVEKMPEGDLWAITTRIKYGDHDLTVPVAVEVKWAGSTPVIVLDDLTIPGLGTFSARVVLHKDKYAGTWQHDAVGGHLFGTIELGK